MIQLLVNIYLYVYINNYYIRYHNFVTLIYDRIVYVKKMYCKKF